MCVCVRECVWVSARNCIGVFVGFVAVLAAVLWLLQQATHLTPPAHPPTLTHTQSAVSLGIDRVA